MKREELQNYLQDQIPISKALGATIRHVNASGAEIWAPLQANRNHLGTAFGGSLNSVLILACYVWLFNILDEQKLTSHVVVSSTQTRYLHPVEGDFSAVCLAPDPESVARFFKAVRRNKPARIVLRAAISGACEFEGEFAALPG